MATGRVIRSFLVCPSSEADSLLERLQLWGGMEISAAADEDPPSEPSEEIHRISFIVDLLQRYAPRQSLFSKLRDGMPEIEYGAASELKEELSLDTDYTRLRGVDTAIKEFQTKKAEAVREISLMKELEAINVSSSSLRMKTVEVRIGVFGDKPAAASETVFRERVSGEYFAVYYLKKAREEAALPTS